MTKRRDECNARPASDGNVRQSPGRTYLMSVKNIINRFENTKNCRLFLGVVHRMSTNSEDGLAFGHDNKLSLSTSTPKGVDDYRSSTQLAGASIRSAIHEWKSLYTHTDTKDLWRPSSLRALIPFLPVSSSSSSFPSTLSTCALPPINTLYRKVEEDQHVSIGLEGAATWNGKQEDARDFWPLFFKKKKREKKGRRSSQSAISIGLEKNPPFFFTCIVSLPSISKCDRAEWSAPDTHTHKVEIRRGVGS